MASDKYATGYVTMETLKGNINSIIDKASNLTQTMKNREFKYIDEDHYLYDINVYKGKLDDPYTT